MCLLWRSGISPELADGPIRSAGARTGPDGVPARRLARYCASAISTSRGRKRCQPAPSTVFLRAPDRRFQAPTSVM